ncbi:hypothetical protein PUMCH_000929 [Australozyma saopauloensis]|uniref:Exportin-T n=1 Tax=Australozyma saopauloensis TaxID=291208 RepID=A0AAX4H545_9ASCO|nr:hypothetical protein PUMCH_000929 [[Candida] saopauloensis]
MDQQIQQAVEIALLGTSDSALKNQAITFINEIKLTEEGYKTCVDLLLDLSSRDGPLNDGLKFFIFQVIDENIDRLLQEQLFTLDSSLFKYLENVLLKNSDSDPVYLKNKFADLLGKLFCHVYPLLDTAFLSNLLIPVQSKNLASVDYYLRILIAIHFEIGDKLIARADGAQERNNRLKDLIRDRDMAALVTSWKTILLEFKDPVIADNALKVVGYYIDWMEITLFIQKDFLDDIYGFLYNDDLRNQACFTIIEIISKKMKPANKLQLINLMDLGSVLSSLDNVDLDFIENLAKLSNQIGLELSIVLENEPSLVSEISAHFLKLWPTVLEFLGNEYDDVSQQVFPFIQQYLFVTKKVPALASEELLSTLLKKIIEKMKYDPESFEDDEDEQFDDIRQKLKQFQDTIASLHPALYLEILPVIINNSIFSALSASDLSGWVSIELGLYELSNFADSLKNNLINLPKSEILTSKPYQSVQDFLIKIIDNFHLINHPKNQLAFFELIIRHFTTKNFSNTTNTDLNDLIFKIMELFSEYGLFNAVESVRLRCWYLFLRFVSVTKPKLNSYFLETFIVKLQVLLVIKAELPTKNEDDVVVENGNFDNQLRLFEVVGLLVAFAEDGLDAPKFVDILFQPLFSTLETCVSYDNKLDPLIALQAHHLLMAMATIVKGLDTQIPGKSDSMKNNADLVSKIDNAAQVVLITLENFNKFESVRDASRFAFARFVPILNLLSSSHVSKLVSLILTSPELRISELGDFSGFIGQLVHLFKNDDIMFQLLNDVLTPMINKVYDLLEMNDENYPDLVREKYGLKRALLTFVSTLVINNQFSLFLTETNKRILPKVLASIVDFSCDLNDTVTTKAAIIQFGNVVNVLGCNAGKINDTNDKFALTVAAVDGIDDYLMEKTVALAFEMPFRQKEFDLKDAQIRNISLELGTLLRIYQNRLSQQEFVTYLANYLTNMGLEQSIAGDFCSKLVELDVKGFKKYYISFLTQFKGN